MRLSRVSNAGVLLELDGVKLRFVRVTAEKLPYDEPFALSGLRVFGLGNDAAPEAVKAFDSVRSDTLTEKLSWKAADRAIGYNVRFGIAHTLQRSDPAHRPMSHPYNTAGFAHTFYHPHLQHFNIFITHFSIPCTHFSML